MCELILPVFIHQKIQICLEITKICYLLFLCYLLLLPSSHFPCSFLETVNVIPFSRSILDRFWPTWSQMTDNAVLHHIMKKSWWFFYENSEMSSKKEFQVLDSLETLVKLVYLPSCGTRFPFFIDFQILRKILVLSKSSQNLYFSKIFSTFERENGVLWPSPPLNFFLSKSSFMIRFW